MLAAGLLDGNAQESCGTANTMGRAQVLANGSDPHVETITRNVVNELSR